MYVCTYSKTTPSPKINKDLAKQRLVILMMFLWKLQILRVKLFIWAVNVTRSFSLLALMAVMTTVDPSYR